MTEHLPECPCQCAYDCGGPCICDSLRACEKRVTDAAVQRVEAIPDDRDYSLDWNWDYDIEPTGMTRNPLVWIREAVAAIKGDQP